MASPHRTASCTWGQPSIEARGEPRGVGIGRCQACRRRTGSAFATIAAFDPPYSVKGIATGCVRTGDHGSKSHFRFCPVRGTRLFHADEGGSGSVSVEVGGFGDPTFPETSVYDCRRFPCPGLPPGIRVHDGDPRG